MPDQMSKGIFVFRFGGKFCFGKGEKGVEFLEGHCHVVPGVRGVDCEGGFGSV